MLFLLLGMELKTVSHIGSLRTLGGKAGVTMVTLRWRWGKTCVVLQPVLHIPLLFSLIVDK
uniref:Cysteine protease n=1 Tax=Rhizophora mucronata TaxID=61149 RepID=A0A2P2L5A2_RHIMU